jgi:hypothetical protein
MYHVLEDLEAERRINAYLKRIFGKYVVRILIGFIWLSIRCNGGI